jgi:hypothetical protein
MAVSQPCSSVTTLSALAMRQSARSGVQYSQWSRNVMIGSASAAAAPGASSPSAFTSFFSMSSAQNSRSASASTATVAFRVCVRAFVRLEPGVQRIPSPVIRPAGSSTFATVRKTLRMSPWRGWMSPPTASSAAVWTSGLAG